MTSRDFCYWLQGFFELTSKTGKGLTEEQTKKIAAHLNMVFKHEIDPSMGDETHQEILSEIHDAAESVAPKFPNLDPHTTLIRC